MTDRIKNINRIVISRTDRIGDVILTLPLAAKAKEIFPNAKIYFLCNEYVKDIVSLSADVDEILIFNNNLSELKSVFNNIKPDLIINSFPDFKIALAGILSGIKFRIGTAYRWYSFLFNLKVKEHRKECKHHEYEYNINLLKNFFPELNYNFNYKLKRNLFTNLDYLNLPEKYFILHPTSGGSSVDVSPEILKIFLSKYNGQEKIIITGSENDETFNSNLLSGINNEKIINLTGKLNLNGLVSLISGCELMIANSTGPLHIAGMLNKPVIGFYPEEIPMNEKRWGPLSDEKYILRPQKITEIEILNTLNLYKSKKQ